MHLYKKLMLVAGGSLAAMCLASAAGATTVVNVVSPSPLDASVPADSFGEITPVTADQSTTYDWTFGITGGTVGALSQLQASITVSGGSDSEPIEFELFKGTPGSGTLLETSPDAVGASTFDASLPDGSYYIQLDPANIAKEGELVTGGIEVSAVSAAPEPATWTMMLLGIGGLGMAMRASRRKQLGAFTAAA